MHTINYKVVQMVRKVKKDPARWTPWARKIPCASHSLHDKERPPASHSPSLVPGPPTIPTAPSDRPLSLPPPLSFTSYQALHCILSTTGERGPHETCDDLIEPADAVTSDSPGQRQESAPDALPDDLCSDEGRLFQQELTSEYSALAAREDTVDDLNRDVEIIVECDGHERTYRYQMLIDSGNPHANLISRRVVDDLHLPHAQSKPSFTRRVLSKLAPWTNAGMAARVHARGQIRNIDGTLIDGQDGTVTISWFGKNRGGSSDSILWFQPRRYKTTHVVVDASRCAADIILSWKEVETLKLRQRFTGAIYRPPTPKSDPGDEKYQDYERRRAENSASRRAARDQKPGQSQSSSADSAKQARK